MTSVRLGDAATTTRAESESLALGEDIELVFVPKPPDMLVNSSPRSNALPAMIAERSCSSGFLASSTCQGKLGIRKQAKIFDAFSERS